MKFIIRRLLIIEFFAFAIGTILLFISCGKGDDFQVQVRIVQAIDGATCYVIVQGTKAVGGNCK